VTSRKGKWPYTVAVPGGRTPAGTVVRRVGGGGGLVGGGGGGGFAGRLPVAAKCCKEERATGSYVTFCSSGSESSHLSYRPTMSGFPLRYCPHVSL
jgi:hypothetical protein